jgi:ankyrin repeat protein
LAIRNSNDKLRLEIISQLLKNGGNPNAGNREGSTPVHFAVCDKRNNSLKVLKLLLQFGGNIDKCNRKGITPFVLATRFKYCSPEVKAHILKISRQTRSPETSWLNGIKENIHPTYVQIINLLKQVPVGLFVVIVIILLLYMFLFLYPIFF